MRLFHASVLVVAFAFTGTAIAVPATHKLKGSQFAGGAKVTLIDARATAVNARPGKITDEELEKEAGGSGLRYSFDMTVAGKTYEVGVDAKTGAVLQNKAEGKNPD